MLPKAILVALLLIPQIVLGATWTVAKDGTGQYSEIQDAIDIAATGDSIVVGPGRYDEFRPYEQGTNVDYCIVHVDSKGLSIIGSGESTIIGPEDRPIFPSVNNTYGIQCHSLGLDQCICNIIVENVFRGVLIQNSDIDISYIHAQWCWQGIMVTEYTTGSIVYVNVSNCLDIGMGLSLIRSPFLVNGCTFEGNTWGFNADWMSHGVVLQNSLFINNTSIGIQYATSSSGTINNCEVGGSNTGIVIAGSSTVEIYNTIAIPTLYRGMIVYNGSIVSGNGNIIHGMGEYPAIQIGASSITMSESHIIKGDGFAVYAVAGPGYTFDLRNNYWGTNDVEEIAALIWDASDDPNLGTFVQYSPFYGHPVSNEDMSFGEIKAMFRR